MSDLKIRSLIERIKNDSKFRSLLTGRIVLTGNLIYALFNVYIGIRYQNYWFISMAVWYLIIGMLRLMAAMGNRDVQRKRKTAGAAICFLAVVLSGIICMGIVERRNPIRNEIIMIALALYTFVSMSLAIINVVKARKRKDAFLEIQRDISLVSAIGSMLSLERSMLGTFGDASDKLTFIMETATGAVAFVLISLIGLSLIKRKTAPDRKTDI